MVETRGLKRKRIDNGDGSRPLMEAKQAPSKDPVEAVAARERILLRQVEELTRKVAELQPRRASTPDFSDGISDHEMRDAAIAAEQSQSRRQAGRGERGGVESGDHGGAASAITSSSRTYLNFKSHEYDALKAKGAWYDVENKALFVRPGVDLAKFSEHIVPPEHAVKEALHVNFTKAELEAKGVKLSYHGKPDYSYYIKPGSDKRDYQSLIVPFKEDNHRNETTYLNINKKNEKQFWSEMEKDGGALKKLLTKGDGDRWGIKPGRDMSQFGAYLANDKYSSNAELLLDQEKVKRLSKDVLEQMHLKVVKTGEAHVVLLPRGADGSKIKHLLEDSNQLGRGVHAPGKEERERSIGKHDEVISKVLEARPDDRSRAHAHAGR